MAIARARQKDDGGWVAAVHIEPSYVSDADAPQYGASAQEAAAKVKEWLLLDLQGHGYKPQHAPHWGNYDVGYRMLTFWREKAVRLEAAPPAPAPTQPESIAVAEAIESLIEKNTPILPFVVADNVIQQWVGYLESVGQFYLGVDLNERSDATAEYLVARAETAYRGNKTFKSRIHGRGDAGRDTLYAFMHHWMMGQMIRSFPALATVLRANDGQVPEYTAIVKKAAEEGGLGDEAAADWPMGERVERTSQLRQNLRAYVQQLREDAHAGGDRNRHINDGLLEAAARIDAAIDFQLALPTEVTRERGEAHAKAMKDALDSMPQGLQSRPLRLASLARYIANEHGIASDSITPPDWRYVEQEARALGIVPLVEYLADSTSGMPPDTAYSGGLVDEAFLASNVGDLPFAVVKQRLGGNPEVIERFATLVDAEAFIAAKAEADPKGVVAGDYGIDGPEELAQASAKVRPQPLSEEEGVKRLAACFLETLKRDIGPEDFDRACLLNLGETSSGVCHSHDFCDANMTMDEAYRTTFRVRETNVDDAKVVERWNAAWEVAVQQMRVIAQALSPAQVAAIGVEAEVPSERAAPAAPEVPPFGDPSWRYAAQKGALYRYPEGKDVSAGYEQVGAMDQSFADDTVRDAHARFLAASANACRGMQEPERAVARLVQRAELGDLAIERLRGMIDFFDAYVTTLPDRKGKEMLGVDFDIEHLREVVERWDADKQAAAAPTPDSGGPSR